MVDKPKVGWEHRYRVSNLKNEPNKKVIKPEKLEKKFSKTNEDADKPVEEKPKVGWEFRYRVSHKLQDDKNSQKLKKRMAEKVGEDRAELISKKNENVGKIGFEFRYRLSNKLSTSNQTEYDEILNSDEKITDKNVPKKKISQKKQKDKKKITVIDEKPKVVFTIQYEKILKKDHHIKKVLNKTEKSQNSVPKANTTQSTENNLKSNSEALVEKIVIEEEQKNETKNDQNGQMESKVEIEDPEQIGKDKSVEKNAQLESHHKENFDQVNQVGMEIDVEVNKTKKNKKQKKEKKKRNKEHQDEEVVKIDEQIGQKNDQTNKEIEEEKYEKSIEDINEEIQEKPMEKINERPNEETNEISLNEAEIVNVVDEEIEVVEVVQETQNSNAEIESNEQDKLRQTEFFAEETEPIDDYDIKTEIKTSLNFFESIKEILASAPSFFDMEENEEMHDQLHDQLHDHHFSNNEDTEEIR